MTGESIVFYALSAVVIATSLYVVLTPHLFRAALGLAFAFLGVAGLYLLLQAEFVAAVQVLIYVGAITVLILFAVMLTSQIGDRMPTQAFREKIAAFLGAGGMLVLMLAAIMHRQWPISPEAGKSAPVARIGQLMLSQYLLPFEVTSVILLAVLIGAVVIARHNRETGR